MNKPGSGSMFRILTPPKQPQALFAHFRDGKHAWLPIPALLFGYQYIRYQLYCFEITF